MNNLEPPADTSGEYPMQYQYGFWNQHAGKILAAIAVAVILGFGGWLIQVDRNTVKTNFLLEQIGKDIGELHHGLKAVDGLERQVHDNQRDIEELRKTSERLEKNFNELKKQRRR